MKRALVLAPHLDDETLGCGGTILKYSKEIQFDLLIVTKPTTKYDINENVKFKKIIKKELNFKNIYNLNYKTTSLSTSSIPSIIEKLRKLIIKNKYSYIFTPFIYDIHSDHQITSQAVISATKLFRLSNNIKLFYYETLSETNLNKSVAFLPNKYVDISDHINAKINILKKFNKEIKNHPFPRSIESIKALAILRGSESNFKYAESFNICLDNLEVL